MSAEETDRRHVYRRPDHVIWDEVDGGLRLCDIKTGHLYELNQTAALLWQVVHDREAEELIAAMAEAYPTVERSQIRDDVIELIGRLQACGLLECGNVGAHSQG